MNEVWMYTTIVSCIIIIVLGTIKIMTAGIKPACQKQFDDLWSSHRKTNTSMVKTEKDVLILENNYNTIINKLDKIEKKIENGNK